MLLTALLFSLCQYGHRLFSKSHMSVRSLRKLIPDDVFPKGILLTSNMEASSEGSTTRRPQLPDTEIATLSAPSSC